MMSNDKKRLPIIRIEKKTHLQIVGEMVPQQSRLLGIIRQVAGLYWQVVLRQLL
jgi:hypothetical protein